LGLAGKDLKIPIINMFKDVKENIYKYEGRNEKSQSYK
jgi:hypothetical protein